MAYPLICYIFATYRLYTESVPMHTFIILYSVCVNAVCTYKYNIYTHTLPRYNTQLVLYTYLKCSIYKNIIYIFGRPLPIYLYATYTWFIAYLYTTHCIVRLKTIYVYSPCKLPRVPKHSSYTSYELDINHLNSAHVGLLLLGPAPPRPQGEKEPFGWGWGCVWRSLFIYIYIHTHTHRHIYSFT